jgi:hypothetical protein
MITGRLTTTLNADHVSEVTAHGTSLNYDEAVDFARAELDRVVDSDRRPQPPYS